VSIHRLARRVIGRPLRAGLRLVLRRRIGERGIRRRYRRQFGKPLDLRHPQSFTARLFAQMIRTNRTCDPLQTRLADKLRVRAFVSERVGERYLARLLWQGDDAAAIPFDRLPPSFVLKANHGSGYVIRVDGAQDRKAVLSRAASWLQKNFYWELYEGQYFHIAPRLMVEEYLKVDGADPLVYRLWCFDGEVAMIQVDDVSEAAIDVMSFYDGAWRRLDIQYDPRAHHQDFPLPPHLDEMTRVAGALSKGFAFVRVDLYDLVDGIRFGEMTFTPRGGELFFHPRSWDQVLGEKWAGVRSIPPGPVQQPADDVLAEIA
jgi:hypothetical protein